MNNEQLRDWFAGMAMQGMNASPSLLEAVTTGSILDGTTSARVAKKAYEQADAMMREKSKHWQALAQQEEII